jgi:hypothetical protein
VSWHWWLRQHLRSCRLSLNSTHNSFFRFSC